MGLRKYLSQKHVRIFQPSNPLMYPDLQSARRPVAHCDEIPVPIFEELPDISDEDSPSIQEDKEEEEMVLNDKNPHPFTQKN